MGRALILKIMVVWWVLLDCLQTILSTMPSMRDACVLSKYDDAPGLNRNYQFTTLWCFTINTNHIIKILKYNFFRLSSKTFILSEIDTHFYIFRIHF